MNRIGLVLILALALLPILYSGWRGLDLFFDPGTSAEKEPLNQDGKFGSLVRAMKDVIEKDGLDKGDQAPHANSNTDEPITPEKTLYAKSLQSAEALLGDLSKLPAREASEQLVYRFQSLPNSETHVAALFLGFLKDHAVPSLELSERFLKEVLPRKLEGIPADLASRLTFLSLSKAAYLKMSPNPSLAINQWNEQMGKILDPTWNEALATASDTENVPSQSSSE